MRVKEMKRIIISESDEKFIEYIRVNFESKRTVNVSDYRNNLDVLNKLDDDTLTTGIARIEAIESLFSSIKSLSFIFTLIAAIVTYYKELAKSIFGDNEFSNFLPLVITIIIFYFTCYFYVRARDKVVTCVFFKSLLVRAKEIKTKKEHSNY